MHPLFFIALPIVYIVLQWSALRRMQSGWLVAAWLPLYFLILSFAVMVIGIASNSAFAILALVAALPVATGYLLLLWLLHLLFGPHHARLGRSA
jgi:hypothetical protein